MARSSSKVAGTVAFFVFIAATHYFIVPPYNGYLIGFAVLLAEAARTGRLFPHLQRFSAVRATGMAALLLATILVTVANGADVRDIGRDAGVFLAFVVGRFALPALFGPHRLRDLLRALSILGVFDALATLFGAALAYRAGASAYEWRGDYLPVAHNWIPYLLVVNIALARLEPHQRARYLRRAALCVLATLASLSRTDIGLDLILGSAMLIVHRRALFASWQRVVTVGCALLALVAVIYASTGLNAVQQRVDAGVGEDDPSVGWRLIEDLALLDYFDQSGLRSVVLGFGWGARMPLPPGVTDFDGNDTLPFLHNSLLTVMLKFGVVGLVVLLVYITRRLRHAWHLRSSPAAPFLFAGVWLILFNLANAVTLQGLTEWSQVVFFGIGCCLLTPRSAARPRPARTSTALRSRTPDHDLLRATE